MFYCRLWIRTRRNSDPDGIQSINYMNVVPKCHNPEGFEYTEAPNFETLTDAISNFNTSLSNQPIKGELYEYY